MFLSSLSLAAVISLIDSISVEDNVGLVERGEDREKGVHMMDLVLESLRNLTKLEEND